MSTVQVDTAGDLVLVHIPGRDEMVAISAYEAMDLFYALAEAVPELQAALADTVALMTPRPKRRTRR